MKNSEKYMLNRDQAHALLDAAGRSGCDVRKMEHSMVDRFWRFVVEFNGSTCEMYAEGFKSVGVNLFRAKARFWLVDQKVEAVS
jgi:hypothetical protein